MAEGKWKDGVYYTAKDMQDIAYASPEGQAQRQRSQFNRDRSMMGQHWKSQGQYAQGKGAFGNIPNIPNIGEGLFGTDRNWPKYNPGAAIRQHQQGRQDSFADKMIDFQYLPPSPGSFGGDAPWKTKGMLAEEKALGGLGGNWWDDAAAGLGKLGASDYGKLFLGGVEAYQGYKAGKRAEEQQKFARETFDFQKAAYKEQTGYQRRGINNQIRAQQDILKSAFYADPERAKSLKLLEV